MGYYTRYELEWKPLKEIEPLANCDHKVPKGAKFCPECGVAVGAVGISERISRAIREAKEQNSENFYALEEDGSGSDACKWYEHESDMIDFSRKFPDVLFTLKGIGEESGDIWTKYFVNGKVQVAKAKIIVDGFDPKSLTTPATRKTL